ncbi:uncharacterized protein LOC116012269 [Ipomoea triloba]|uniref:uncharacterized protein LOC116012269 n=1 Tax=Ipomoea triloba TaxID=35885 RepID=UPI00125DF12E|nr:uncharacterized protein LOC116012269 [Ipomoea triloba]
MRSRRISSLFKTRLQNFSFSSSPPLSRRPHRFPATLPPKPGLLQLCNRREGFASSLALRYLSTTSSEEDIDHQSSNGDHLINYDTSEEVEPIDSWEEEEEVEPEIGDGGDGGGVVFRNCPWGEQALSIAHEVLKEHTVDMELYAFKTSPRGYIYVRLDKLTNEYGCPSMDEIEHFSHQYKKRLDEAGAMGEFPEDLALEVSSPGADRLLKVPDDLNRFKHMPMRVSFVEDEESRAPETNKIFFLESIDADSGSCVWKLVDVKENRSPSAKGRPLSRKQKDWRLTLPYAMIKQVTLYLPC